MLLSIMRYLKGYVKIRITGYSPERFINACRHRKIVLWGLKSHKGSYEMYTSVKGFKMMKPVIKKTAVRVAVIGRYGLPFVLYKYRKRKVFCIGAVLNVCVIYLLSLFIWDINVTGNISYSDETIISYLEDLDVDKGMLKSKIDCAEIVKDIRKNYDDIVWVSASINGTRLFVNIKENETLEKEKLLDKPDSMIDAAGNDIIAAENCIIKEIVTRKGTPLVTPGVQVEKGDVLVSGLVEVLDDNKELIEYKIENAQAVIRGEYESDYEKKISLKYEEKEYIEPEQERLYIRVGSKLFCIGSKKNNFKKSQTFSKERLWNIGEYIGVPVYIGKRITQPYVTKEKAYSREEVRKILTKEFDKYCENLDKKGVEIIEKNVRIYIVRNFAVAQGTLTIICDIGEEKEMKTPELPMEVNLNGYDRNNS